tara:strand:+ start:611 stop:2191 length:1581 start_codon:yes stop_codon:yes gene_type:complete
MPTNETRRELLNRIKATGYPGGITEVFQASDQGRDLIEEHQIQQEQQEQQEMQVANTPQQQEVGLREQHAMGNTQASMAFPDVQPNQSFNTVGMQAPIDIQKVDNQGHLVESYKSVPPGIQDLPTGPSEGTIIESPAAYQKGGVKTVKPSKKGNIEELKSGEAWYQGKIIKKKDYKTLEEFRKDYPEATGVDGFWVTDDQGPYYQEPDRKKHIEGCTDPDAKNYNPKAELDDGSCRGKDMKPIKLNPAQPIPIASADEFSPILATREYHPRIKRKPDTWFNDRDKDGNVISRFFGNLLPDGKRGRNLVTGKRTSKSRKTGLTKQRQTGGYKEFNTEKFLPEEKMSQQEMFRRQRYKESRFNPKAKNKKSGAMGISQFMPKTILDMKKSGAVSKDFDPYNPQQAIDAQEKYMKWISERPYINKGTEEVVRAKTLAGYNMGVGNINKTLTKMREDGINIYDDTNWVKKIPQYHTKKNGEPNVETPDYINKILLKNNKKFEKEYIEGLTMPGTSPRIKRKGGYKVRFKW